MTLNSIDVKKIKVEIISSEKDSFGLIILCSGEKYKEYSDITKDYKALSDLKNKINRANVSPLHIDDIIEDFIG